MQKDCYRIIKTDSDLFTAATPAGRISCRARKKNKKGEILAGDFVRLEDGAICEVLPRRNRLIRPPVANLDQVLFVVGSVPKPDYLLLDKAIVNCLICGVDVIICINKSDINSDFFIQDIKNQYIGRNVITSSAVSGDVGEIKKILQDKLTCLAGQSAVGKSSIIAALLGDDAKKNIKIGELSAIERGKNTTASVELYDVCGGFLADTPGFSLLDFQGLKSAELELYYPEFEDMRPECRYHRCTHTKEPDCAVRAAVLSGKINNDRYQRYLKLFEDVKQQELNKY